MPRPEQSEPNIVIKGYVEADGPQDWKHRETTQFLYRTFDVARFAFFSPRDETQPVLPQSVIAVDGMRVETLAAYRLTYNPNGLPFEIVLNSRWIARPRWELAESLVHEMVHLYQEYLADQGVDGMQKSKNGYHNKQFVELCEDLGLHPIIGVGAHWRPADGQFERLMGQLGIEKPEHAKAEGWVKPDPGKKGPNWFDADRGRPKGKSTLVLYTSDQCERKPECKIRAGRKDMDIRCNECGGDFHPHL